MVRRWSLTGHFLILYYPPAPALKHLGAISPSVHAFPGGEPVDTRSSASKPISRIMAYCRAFGTHYEVKPCNSRAELTGGQPQSQPAHNHSTVGLVPIAQTTGTIGTQPTQVTCVNCPISCCTHERTHLQVHHGSPLQVRTRSPLQVRAR
jgi:hypothetical protein